MIKIYTKKINGVTLKDSRCCEFLENPYLFTVSVMEKTALLSVTDVFAFLGYLAVSLFLNESHELLLLLVNTVLKVGVDF